MEKTTIITTNYDIAIIGGGAAGLMAASLAAGAGVKVILLEKREVCGKKLLLTGKGRCNITNANEWEDFAQHIHPDQAFLKQSFMAFSNTDTIEYLNKLGLQTVCERGKRIFPASGRSKDVRDTFLKKIHTSDNVTVKTDAEVSIIKKKNEHYQLGVIVSKNGKLALEYIHASLVIVTTGGLSYPITGSTGDGYQFAGHFGHEIIRTHPSLTALMPIGYTLKLNGLNLKNVSLSLIVDGGVVQSEFGEITFTENGIEGALGFRVSRNAVRALDDGKNVEVSIDLKPAVTAEQLKNRIQREYRPGVKLNYFLENYLPMQAVVPFIESSKDVTVNNLPVKLKNWKFHIKDYTGYSRSVVTAGGVSLKEISRKTMESKLSPGLYFAGEVLNLDGDTGGYNLQIAFSTAAAAIRDALEKIKNN